MPFQDAHDMPEFKEWLITTLEPMCDADPAVMSDYIIALLKHEADMSEQDWKLFISRELADFLDEKSTPFVNTLFEVLHTKSFLPSASAPVDVPANSAVNPAMVSSYRPIPTEPSSSTVQRISSPVQYPEAESGPSTIRPANGSVDVSMSDAQPEQGGDVAPVKEKCFDYHERGFCLRGVNCPYDHSDDAIVPDPEQMFRTFSTFQQAFMPRGGRGGRGGRGRGHHPGFPTPFGFPFPVPPPFAGRPPRDKEASAEFSGSNRPPQDRSSTTLLVSDIPRNNLSIPVIRDYFRQFGEITNVALEGKSSRALVSFASNAEAYKAWRSDEAVFGSRHVRVLWHRPRPGHGQAGQQALEASAGIIANLRAMEDGQSPQQGKSATLLGPESRLRATLTELEAKERDQKKERLVAEQKVLLKKTENAVKEEKLEILKRLKELQKEMEALDKPPEDVSMELGDKEKLDMELAKHGMETAQGKDEQELLRLNAQLSALRDKANTLGINSSARYSPYSRPRGRGRGFPSSRGGRGRGGFPQRMSLDNRSRILKIVAEDQTIEGSEKLKEWYESTGGVVMSKEGGMVVRYPNREMAERALAMGTKEVGIPVQASWLAEPSSTYTNGNGHQEKSDEVEMMDESGRREHDEEE
ncbi:hypothetical protein M231_02029 [Tremella mesenterica]|uniref:C3H1-type domain-containing protein n=1 Tax=Tremella mesenterica TaxID=5217 RepID=A0A4Q1BS13_TREME|nr:hypothetical protein M231_02029 [Tremella mesenterica]